jgi:hypothetical protein
VVSGNTVGSTTGAAPNVTKTMATSPIEKTNAHTPKEISGEIRRSRIAIYRYRIVGENRVMLVSQIHSFQPRRCRAIIEFFPRAGAADKAGFLRFAVLAVLA